MGDQNKEGKKEEKAELREEKQKEPASGEAKGGTKGKEDPSETPGPKEVRSASDKKDEKRRKLARMNLAEIEECLKNAEEHMGGFQSAYARSLLERKRLLTKGAAESYRKAA